MSNYNFIGNHKEYKVFRRTCESIVMDYINYVLVYKHGSAYVSATLLDCGDEEMLTILCDNDAYNAVYYKGHYYVQTEWARSRVTDTDMIDILDTIEKELL